MILTKFVKLKWNRNNKKFYTLKGYKFTNYGDEFLVHIKDLSKGSSAIVQVQCEYCKKIYDVKYCNYQKVEKYCCHQCSKKKEQETNLKKYHCKNPMQNDTVKQKMYQTNLKKYGNKCSLQNKNVQLKVKHLKECPLCHKTYKLLSLHIKNSHNEFYKEQVGLIQKQINNLNISKNTNLIEYNIYLSYCVCCRIWKEFDKTLYDKRVKNLTSKNISKAKKGMKMSDKWRQHLSEAHKGQKAWNCGLDMSDKRVYDNIMKRNHTIAEQNKLKYKTGEMVAWKTGLTNKNSEKVRKISEKTSKTMAQKEQYNSRGIAGIRPDLGFFCASTYEANIYRIYQYYNKKDGIDYKREYNNIFPVHIQGQIHYYRIDIQDACGLFGNKNQYIEVKGYMNEESIEKINAFRKEYPNYKLIVIGGKDTNPDIDYFQLQEKYQPLIPLWETKKKNIRVTPWLYNKI